MPQGAQIHDPSIREVQNKRALDSKAAAITS
jgi:hypothetical protein